MPGKTLEQLEGSIWPEPDFASSLVLTCNRLRKKPVDEFTAEDLRIMIGQEIGLPYLVPRALELLEREPLTEGDFYPGDLLVSVVEAKSFLLSSPDLLSRVRDVVRQALPRVAEDDTQLLEELRNFIEPV